MFSFLRSSLSNVRPHHLSNVRVSPLHLLQQIRHSNISRLQQLLATTLKETKSGGIVEEPSPILRLISTPPRIDSPSIKSDHSRFVCFACHPEPIAYDELDFLLHNFLKHPDNNHPCNLCGSKFETEELLKAHLDSKDCLLYGPLWDCDLGSDITEKHWELYQSTDQVACFPTINQANEVCFDIIMAEQADFIVVYASQPDKLFESMTSQFGLRGVAWVTFHTGSVMRDLILRRIKLGLTRVLITSHIPTSREIEIIGPSSITIHYDMPLLLCELVNKMAPLPKKVYHFFPTDEPLGLITKNQWDFYQKIEKIDFCMSVNLLNKKLFDIINAEHGEVIVVFCGRSGELSALLIEAGIQGVICLTLQMNRETRVAVLQQMKLGGARVLIMYDFPASDMTSIGPAGVIVNYDMPFFVSELMKNRLAIFGTPKKVYNFLTKE